jgi:uncharacterized protein
MDNASQSLTDCVSYLTINTSFFGSAAPYRLPNITLHSYGVDGYIAQAHPSSPSFPVSPCAILSAYFKKPVHLVYKGPCPRRVVPTAEFPKLEATSVFQDMYPLLVLSEEGMAEVEREAKKRVGQQGIGEIWKEGKVAIQR